jgi:hypothetical protein
MKNSPAHGQVHAPLAPTDEAPRLRSTAMPDVLIGNLPDYVPRYGRKLALLKRLPAFADTEKGLMA